MSTDASLPSYLTREEVDALDLITHDAKMSPQCDDMTTAALATVDAMVLRLWHEEDDGGGDDPDPLGRDLAGLDPSDPDPDLDALVASYVITA